MIRDPRGLGGRLRAAAFCLVAAATAAAQDDPLQPPPLEDYVRWGPFRVRPAIGVSNLGYDDNVFFTNDNQDQRGDYRITLSPRLEGLLLFGRRAFLKFDEQLDYTVYRKFDDQNFLNSSFTSRTIFPLRRVGLFGDLDVIRRKDRPTSELDRRLTRREERLGAGVIFRLGWRTHAELGVSRTDWTHSDPDPNAVDRLLDRIERGGRVSVEYRATGQTRLMLSFEREDITFDAPEVARDADERSWLVGVRFGERGLLGGRIELGVARIDLLDPAKRDFSGSIGQAELLYRLGTGTTLMLEGHRQVGFAVFQSNNFYLDESVSARVTHFLNRVFGVELGASRGELSFPQSDSPLDRVDRLSRNEIALLTRVSSPGLGRRVEYSIRLRRWRRDSNEPFDDLDQGRTTIGVAATVGF